MKICAEVECSMYKKKCESVEKHGSSRGAPISNGSHCIFNLHYPLI